MKRFHVHVAVDKLDESIRFYSALFGVEPSVMKPDYAKWMLEDPRLNFAISRRGHAPGLNHLGFQLDSDAAMQEMRVHLGAADSTLVEQTGAACCYAKSDKYWVTDPSGIAWETFHTLTDVPVFGQDAQTNTEGDACCVPIKTGDSDKPDSGYCIPSAQNSAENKSAACCG